MLSPAARIEPLTLPSAPMLAEEMLPLLSRAESQEAGQIVNQSPFASVVALIKAVLQVPQVTITIDGLAIEGAPGLYRSFLEVPLIQGEKRIGSLRVLDTAERTFSEKESVLLRGFARLVLEQLWLWHEVSRDALTQALTRRFFFEETKRALLAATRRGRPVAVVLFDLDHFKKINDTFGHAAGDAALRAAAQTIQGELRASDRLGRIGGEEFAVLLPDTDAECAAEVAERLRRALAAMVVPGHEGLSVTASFGLAAALPEEAATSAPETMLEAADQALYRAKRAGRNRVERAEKATTPEHAAASGAPDADDAPQANTPAATIAKLCASAHDENAKKHKPHAAEPAESPILAFASSRG